MAQERPLSLGQMHRLDKLPEETKVVGWRTVDTYDGGPIIEHPDGRRHYINHRGRLIALRGGAA